MIPLTLSSADLCPDTKMPRPSLSALNEFITCGLCKGYLIDASTTTECFHLFCKSCLVKHYDESNMCPNWSCGKIINLMHGTKVFRSDPGIQSIVNKVVPNLVHDELQRETEYYESRGLPLPSNSVVPAALRPSSFAIFDDSISKVGIELLPIEGTPEVPFPLMRCLSLVTIQAIKKHIAFKLLGSIGERSKINVYFNEEKLKENYTLKNIIENRFRKSGTRKGPLPLYYELTSTSN